MAHKSKAKKDKKPARIVHPVQPRPVIIRGNTYYLQHARELPFAGCWIDREWKEMGLARVVVTRLQDSGSVILGIYLVDYYCLGVKDAFYRMGYTLKHLERDLPQFTGDPEPCTPEFAHQLIYQSIEYAHRYGFEPHPDFEKAGLILDPPGTYPLNRALKFGKDGKPLYVSGPHDQPERIVATLMRTAGEGNFNYFLGIGDPDLDF